MSEAFGSDYLTIEDEDGNEFELEVLDEFELDGQSYLAALPADMDEDDPDFGIILLKSLFSEAMQTDSGEEVSSYEIKNILQQCIDEEDKRKPLTDETLMDILNSKGYRIARRTVAKYREMLSIPVARLRKQI